MIALEIRLERGGSLFEMRLTSSSRMIGIEGPSGVGKTTLLRVLAGLEPKAQGFVSVDRRDWQRDKTCLRPWQRRVGWVPQDARLFPHLSVLDNLAYSGASTGGELEEIASQLRIAHLLARSPRDLSGGERQRISLGRAILSRPRWLLLDEPFSALEKELRQNLLSWLHTTCQARGIGCVVTTHHAEEWGDLFEESWRMRSGGRLELLSKPPTLLLTGMPFSAEGPRVESQPGG